MTMKIPQSEMLSDMATARETFKVGESVMWQRHIQHNIVVPIEASIVSFGKKKVTITIVRRERIVFTAVYPRYLQKKAEKPS